MRITRRLKSLRKSRKSRRTQKNLRRKSRVQRRSNKRRTNKRRTNKRTSRRKNSRKKQMIKRGGEKAVSQYGFLPDYCYLTIYKKYSSGEEERTSIGTNIKDVDFGNILRQLPPSQIPIKVLMINGEEQKEIDDNTLIQEIIDYKPDRIEIHIEERPELVNPRNVLGTHYDDGQHPYSSASRN